MSLAHIHLSLLPSLPPSLPPHLQGGEVIVEPSGVDMGPPKPQSVPPIRRLVYSFIYYAQQQEVGLFIYYAQQQEEKKKKGGV